VVNPPPHPLLLKLSFLALAALVAYAPSLTIPRIADDYPNLPQAQTYGSPSGLAMLLQDPQFRLRATGYCAMYALRRAGRVNPVVYHAASLLLHVANVWRVYFVAMAWPRMRAFFFGLALAHAAQKWPRPRLVTAVVTLMLFHSVAYLWTKKRAEFLERAAPTGQLIALARKTSRAIWVRCFPQPPWWRKKRYLWPRDARLPAWSGIGRRPRQSRPRSFAIGPGR
jgi:hypothetical protein